MMAMSVQEKPQITKDTYTKYLKIYNADIDWEPQLTLLSKRLTGGAARASNDVINQMKKQVACTILLPTYDKSAISDPPEKLLFTCSKFSQFEGRDWHADLERIVAQDADNLLTREQAIDFGLIYPIQYSPRARQAFNWLMDSAEASGTTHDIDPNVIRQKMENLVLFYGGAVICNIYNKPEYAKKIGNILNWRTGYFFERLIYEVYKPEEILKIKQHDIAEIQRSHPQLIKKRK